MSQDLFFEKQKILTEEASKNLSPKEIQDGIKAMLKQRDLETDRKLRKTLFEEIEIDLDISAYEKEIKNLLDSEEVEYISPDSNRFMMNKKIWAAVQKIVLSKYNKNKNDLTELKLDELSESQIDEKLKELCQKEPSIQLVKDYSELEGLFKKNLLFVNIH